MKQICSVCMASASIGQLWCQERNCPAENSMYRFAIADQVSDLSILREISNGPTAQIHAALQKGQEVYVKFVPPKFAEKLQREVHCLLKHEHPALPRLVPINVLQNRFIGEFLWRGNHLYYYLFEYQPAVSLRRFLLTNPQPSFDISGKIVMAIAEVVHFLHLNGLAHCVLNPEMILLRFDKEGFPRVLLVDLGVACPWRDILQHWQPDLHYLSYTAPELLESGQLGPTVDVYGTGLILDEMMQGVQRYASKGHSSAAVREAITRKPMKGIVAISQIAVIAQKAAQADPTGRYANLADFIKAIQQFVPLVPGERLQRTWQHWLLLSGLTLILVFLLLGVVIASFGN